MNKWIYLGGVYGLMLPGSFWLGWALVDSKIEEAIPFAAAMMVVGMGFMLTFVYRIWSAINDDQTETTPLAAAGLMLIPLFNIYWVFRVYPGFVSAYNEFAKRQQLAVPELSRGLFLAFAVFSALSAIPFVGGLFSIPNIVLIGLMISKACDAVNRLPPLPQTSNVSVMPASA